jgi:hypothetical protein
MPNILAVFRHQGTAHVLGTVSFSDGDASIYLRPISTADALYDYGRSELGEGVASKEVPTSGQLRASERPHISIHDSGKCHVRTGTGRTMKVDAVDIGRLNAFTGQHIGTILCSDVSTLPRLADVWPDPGAPDEDSEPWDVTPSTPFGSVRVSVFVSRNGQRTRPRSHRFREERRRRADGGALFVALNAFADPALGGDTPAIAAIGGWDPRTVKDLSKSAPFVFVRDILAAPAD